MFASFLSAATRFAFRPAVAMNARRLATEGSSSSLPGAAQAQNGVISSVTLQAPPAASTSASILPRAAAEPPVIHVPPAEDPLLHLFTSMIMVHGKRQQASRVVTRMLLHIHAFTQAPPMPILRQAIAAASPLLRCRSFKRAAKQFVFPFPLSERQRTWQAIDWIIKESRLRRGGRLDEERLAREIIGIVRGDSEVLKKKEAVHKLAVLHRCVSRFVRMREHVRLRAWGLVLMGARVQRECRSAAEGPQVEQGLIVCPGSYYLYISLNLMLAALLARRAHVYAWGARSVGVDLLEELRGMSSPHSSQSFAARSSSLPTLHSCHCSSCFSSCPLSRSVGRDSARAYRGPGVI